MHSSRGRLAFNRAGRPIEAQPALLLIEMAVMTALTQECVVVGKKGQRSREFILGGAS
jgi:hypothetical protein